MRIKFWAATVLLLLGFSGFGQAQSEQYLPKPLRQLAQSGVAQNAPERELQTQIAAGAAVKITVREAGLYRVAATQLWAAGLPSATDATRLQLYEGGVEYPLNVSAARGLLEASGYIEFYGVGADTTDTDTRTYWLIIGESAGLRFGPPARITSAHGAATKDLTLSNGFVAPVSGGKEVDGNGFTGGYTVFSSLRPSDTGATNFPYTVARRERGSYFPQLQNGGERDNFWGGIVRPEIPALQVVRVSKLDPSAQTTATVSVTLQGATPDLHRVQVKLNGHIIGEAEYHDQENHTARFSVVASLLQEGDNTLSYLALNGYNDLSLTDAARITYPHRMEAENGKLLFTASGRRVTVGGFSAPEVRLFDLTEPRRAFMIAARVSSEANGYAVNFTPGRNSRVYFAVASGQTLAPVSVTANEPSTLASRSHTADFLIITHKDFRAAVEPLAWLRRGEGLQTEIVTLEDVYDEWNGGNKSANVLREFLRYTQNNWAVAPRYVLLVGDASYDPRNYLNLGGYDFMPTAYINTEFLETSSDVEMADFNGDDSEDFALGRLPARTPAEAARMVGKIINYQPFNGAHPDLLLVTDHASDNDFELAHDELRALLPTAASVREVRRLGLTDEQMRAQTLSALGDGHNIVQYSGHGLIEGWSSAGFLTSSDAPNLANNGRPSIVLTMDCLNGYFHDLGTESLAESLLKAPNGAVAVWASSALTYADGQVPMSQDWFRQVYGPHPAPRLGEVMRLAKAATPFHEVRQTWMLFGDPTLRVKN